MSQVSAGNLRFLPAFLNILSMAKSAELHCGGIHDNVTECCADHVVIIDGADADALQVGQRHHQLLAADREAAGVLPVLLENIKQHIYSFKLISLW